MVTILASISNGNGWNLIFVGDPCLLCCHHYHCVVVVVVVRCWEMCLVRGSVHDWAGELLQWARQPSVQQPGTAESGDAIFTFLVHCTQHCTTVQLYTIQLSRLLYTVIAGSFDVYNNNLEWSFFVKLNIIKSLHLKTGWRLNQTNQQKSGQNIM